MNPKMIRFYKKMDLEEVKEHLLICGDLSASCSKCNCMTLKLEMTHCPECKTDFHYIAFRNIKDNMPKVLKVNETRKELSIIDFDDFKRMTGEAKAQEFFK